MRYIVNATTIMYPMTSSPNTVDSLLASIPILDDRLLPQLRNDLVNEIHNYDTIGRRYGLGNEAGLFAFLSANRGFAQEVASLRAMLGSDISAQDRCRLKGAIASEDLLSVLYEIATNPANSAAVRVDAVKQTQRMGGVDGLPPASKDGGGAGTTFNVNYHFSTGVQAIATTVVAEIAAAIEAPAA